jgi:hypothetical protein
MKHLVSLRHRPANAAGLREVLFRAGALQGMIAPGLGRLTKPGGMDAKPGVSVTTQQGMLTKLPSVLTKWPGMRANPGEMLTKRPGMDAKGRRRLTKASSRVAKPGSGLTKRLFDPFPPRKPPFWACFQPSTPLW